MERIRPTIRVRLTVLYGALFLVAGVALLAVTYVLVKYNLDRRPNLVARRAISLTEPGPGLAAIAETPTGEPITADNARDFILAAENRLRADTLQSILQQGALALGLVAVIAVGFGYLMAERVLRPLHRITETARRVSGGSLAYAGAPVEQIALDGPRDEIKELADTFDEMLQRLGRAFDSQRRFVGNASHELRTPLAINRTLVEVALRRPDVPEDTRRLGESLLEVNARHERLIDGLLTLARGENAVVRRTAVDLRDVAGHVIAQSRAEADEAGVVIRVDLAAAPATGDPVLLERLVQNLVDNAVRHNLAGGWVCVATRQAAAGDPELVVTNTGPLVPPYEVDGLFDAFRRLHVDRLGSDRGAGLGLSIVRAVAGSHGGEVQAAPRDGGGLVVTVRLPSAS
jgi:signal transduction histidine kinase